MNIKIDANGFLLIHRGKDWKEQICPFSTHFPDYSDPTGCGDWCPLFGEPVYEPDEDMGNFPRTPGLWLCRSWITGTITDERK